MDRVQAQALIEYPKDMLFKCERLIGGILLIRPKIYKTERPSKSRTLRFGRDSTKHTFYVDQ